MKHKQAWSMIVVTAFLLAVTIASCSRPGNSYSEFHTIPEAGWAYVDTILFHPMFQDSIAVGSLSLALRHTSDYPFSAVAVEITYPTGTQCVCDTVIFTLADSYGRWIGKGFGASYQMESRLPNHNITLADSSEIRVRQIMRVDTLHGIDQIGVFFTENKLAHTN